YRGRGHGFTNSFLQSGYLIDRYAFEPRINPARPSHLDKIYLCRQTQAEVNPHITIRQVARSATHFIYEKPGADLRDNASANAVTIGFGSNQFQPDPV